MNLKGEITKGDSLPFEIIDPPDTNPHNDGSNTLMISVLIMTTVFLNI